jgi:hypothetical protein
MFGFSAFADAPFASLLSAGQIYSVSITESVTASDAVLFNPDPGTWGYGGWGSWSWGGSVPSEIVESLSASDSQNAYTIYSAVIQETLSASDAQAFTFEINAYVAESITASDTQTNTLIVTQEILESLNALDSQSGGMAYVCSILEVGDAVSVSVGGIGYSVTINETVYTIDSVTARDLWVQIDDIQNANWTLINTLG